MWSLWLMAGFPDSYWATFGIGSFEEFESGLADVFPSSVSWLPYPNQHQLLQLAWYNPASAYGVLATGLVRLRQALGLNDSQLRDQAFAGHADIQRAGGAGMVHLIIPNVYRVGIYGLSGGQPVVNVVGVRGSAAGQAAGAAAAVKAAWKVASGPMSRKSSFYTFDHVSAMDLSSADGAIVESSDGTNGLLASAALATNAASALVKWNGGTRSGSSRGRMYYGPLTETDINADGRTLTSTANTQISTAMDNFRNSLSGAGFPLCVISPTNASSTLVTSHSVESVIASQRRRIRD